MTATPVTLRPMFEADPAMKELGGPGYLARLTGSGAGLIGARQFAQQIYDLAMLRTLIERRVATLVDNAMDTSKEVNPRAQIEAAEEELFKVAADGGSESSIKTFAQASTAAIQMADRALNSGGGVSGVTTGFEHDQRLRWAASTSSDLIILAGRPGMGKTSLATNIAFNAAQRYMQRRTGRDRSQSNALAPKLRSLVWRCPPTSSRRVYWRNSRGFLARICAWARSVRLRWIDLLSTSGELQNLQFVIDDTAGLTIGQLHTRMRRLQRRHGVDGIGMVVVDYLQLLTGQRTQRRTIIACRRSLRSVEALKTLAKDLNVPGACTVAAQPRS